MRQDFKLVRWIDVLSFGGVNILPTFGLIYAICYGVSGQPLLLLSIVAAAFWGISALVLYHRKQFLNRITFITKHQIAVITNGFNVKQSDVEIETDDLIKAWDTACNFNKSASSLEGSWVEFKEYPIKDHSEMGLLAGYTIGNTSVIGWKPNLFETAYQHELGHIIHHTFTGVWNNENCHKFMTDNKLP